LVTLKLERGLFLKIKKKSTVDMTDAIKFIADSTIVVNDEYEFSEKFTFVRGDKLRIHRTRGTFKFIRHVVNEKRDAEWLDVIGRNGQFRAFYVSDVKGPVKKRRPRQKGVKLVG